MLSARCNNKKIVLSEKSEGFGFLSEPFGFLSGALGFFFRSPQNLRTIWLQDSNVCINAPPQPPLVRGGVGCLRRRQVRCKINVS